MNAHWTKADFVQTEKKLPLGSGTTNRFGYCRKCLGDMKSLGGTLRHYQSRRYYRASMRRIQTQFNAAFGQPFGGGGR